MTRKVLLLVSCLWACCVPLALGYTGFQRGQIQVQMIKDLDQKLTKKDVDPNFLKGRTDPELIHIAYGETTDQMSVTWSTFDNTKESVVVYGPSPEQLDKVANGTSTLFTDPGTEKRKQYIHRVVLTTLESGAKYFYRCGSRTEKGGSKLSELSAFNAMKAGNDWSPRFAMYGDFGTTNPQSLDALIKETYLGHFDAILHVGDMAYNMYNDQGRNGDRFLRNIQPIAENIPYMVTVGNHEQNYNYTHFKQMFTMPGNTESMFYSFNIGPAHIIGIAEEFYYFYNEHDTQIANQYRWLEADLQKANLPENREKQPWVILLSHRPMYCSNDKTSDCAKNVNITRIGTYGLEKHMYKYGVDLAVWAHEHSYERLWPIYDYKVLNGSMAAPYTNPRGPVHLIAGSAGCTERRTFFGPRPYWSAFHSSDYGYSRMTVHNATHLYFEQVSDDKGGAVIDTTWLIQYSHGPFHP